jgi:allantoin racemase
MMRVCYLGTRERGHFLQGCASPGVVVEARQPEGGPATIESMVEEYQYVPGVLAAVQQAERDGFDAIITGCFGDPGVDAARELVRIPVIGLGESAMLIAAMLGHRFSILTVVDGVVWPLRFLAMRVGVAEKLASVRAVDIPVAIIRQMGESTYERLRAAAQETLERDGADTLVTGCASMSFYADRLQEDVGVPVVHPLRVALKSAELLVGCGLRHSQRAYPPVRALAPV